MSGAVGGESKDMKKGVTSDDLLPATPGRPVTKPSTVGAAAPSVVSQVPDADTPHRTEGWAAGLLQEALTATYWFDSGDRGKPHSAWIKFSGHRIGVDGKLQPRDRFDQIETVDGIVPGSGPVSITTRAHNINPGEWIIKAEPVSRKGQRRLVRPHLGPPPSGAGSLKRMLWSWGNPVKLASSATPVKTGLAPFARLPGIIPGAWPALVALGVLIGVAIQAVLVARAHLQVGPALAVALAASIVGLVGAKAWYFALHQRTLRGFLIDGMCIQGFVAGVAVVETAALALFHVPVGAFLDALAPGLLLGMAVGRPGCYFAGCCVGRPTASRWGVWGSDRRVGARRVPTQLLEALGSLIIGLAALVLTLLLKPPLPGAMFVGVLAAYTLYRQVLFPFRALPRTSSIGRPLTGVVAALVLIAAIVLSMVAGLR